jgi:hypothetical protein
LFRQQLVARGWCSVRDDGVSGKEEGLGCHQPCQPLHNQVILMLDLVANRVVPIKRTERIERELLRGAGHGRNRSDTRELDTDGTYMTYGTYESRGLTRPYAASPFRPFAVSP